MLAHRPPYSSIIINKYKRRPPWRDMTVCIGLLCTDGVIIGADTEKSGAMKYFSPKVRRESFAAGEYVLTGTGNVGALGMTADVIKCALYSKRERFKKAINAKKERAFSAMRLAASSDRFTNSTLIRQFTLTSLSISNSFWECISRARMKKRS